MDLSFLITCSLDNVLKLQGEVACWSKIKEMTVEAIKCPMNLTESYRLTWDHSKILDGFGIIGWWNHLMLFQFHWQRHLFSILNKCMSCLSLSVTHLPLRANSIPLMAVLALVPVCILKEVTTCSLYNVAKSTLTIILGK